LAGQEDTIIQILNGVDLYCAFASMLYERDITKADELERFVGKQAMLGLQYNCGAERFREMLRQKGVLIPLSEAQDIVTLWRKTYHQIPLLWKQAGLVCEAMAFGGWDKFGTLELSNEGEKLITPENHYLEYHDIRKTRDGFSYKQRKGKNFVDTKIYGGKMVENTCQHLARNIVAEQWNEVAKTWPVKLQSHDEVAMVVPNALADECLEHTIDIFSTAPTWWPDLPLAAEGGIGDTYGEAK